MTRPIRHLYQNGHELYGADYDIDLATTTGDEEGMIAGSTGWIDAYIVKSQGQLVARVPAWTVIADYEWEEK